MTSRRDFLSQAAMAAAGASLTAPVVSALDQTRPPVSSSTPGFIDLHRQPDLVTALTTDREQQLSAAAGGTWSSGGVTVTATDVSGATRIQLSASSVGIKRLHLRWRGRVSDVSRVLGDAWERGYGDLEWRGLVPDRVMPWYVAIDVGTATHAYGVRTGSRAFCYWQVDAQGISLIADVRSGGVGVQLGERTLDVCDVVTRAGRAGESSFAAIHAFCRQMCANPRLPAQPVYGSNDWYWAYGKNSAATVIADAQHVVELSPTGGNRPFAVIDDGWQPVRGKDKTDVGMWNRGNEKFPDMPGLAADVKRAGARPGIWIRPLQATAATPDA